MSQHLLDVYNRLPINFVRGEGAWLFDAQNKKYLDAFSGIAVTGLGHNYKPITKAISEQAAKIIHISNLVEIPEQEELGKILIETAEFPGRVFFSNSGAEAVETLIKLARLYGHSKEIAVPKIIVMENSFHGRTIATITAGGSAKAKAGFEPLLEGFVRVPFNDTEAIEQAVQNDKDIVAVLFEPVQGESGIRPSTNAYIKQVRQLCDKHKLLMLTDEIQCGMGRTGKFFCFQHDDVLPDAISLAKGLANGLPIGATIIRAPYCDLFHPGSHGSTFGGNQLSCLAGVVTVKEILHNNYAANAAKQGAKIIAGLKTALANNPHVKEVRGKGLMIGIELDKECRGILPIALKHGIIFNIAALNTLRLLPPLIINDSQAQQIIDTIPKLIDEFYAQK